MLRKTKKSLKLKFAKFQKPITVLFVRAIEKKFSKSLELLASDLKDEICFETFAPMGLPMLRNGGKSVKIIKKTNKQTNKQTNKHPGVCPGASNKWNVKEIRTTGLEINVKWMADRRWTPALTPLHYLCWQSQAKLTFMENSYTIIINSYKQQEAQGP